MGRKPTVITPERLVDVATLMRRCIAPAKIRRTLMNEWECSPSTAKKAIALVRKQWRQEAAARTTPSDIDEVRNQLDEAAALAFEVKDPGAAVRAISEKGRMMGLYPDRLQITGAGGGPVEVVDGRSALLKALEKLAPDSAPIKALLDEETGGTE